MLLAVDASGDPALVAYRNEILFQQTVTRYAESWHHVQPFYFYVLEVIPVLWLPVSLFLIWLVPHWRTASTSRESRVWLPLSWAILVVVFFSLSPGKRGVYIVPAIPALVIASAPYLRDLWSRRTLQWAGWILSVLIGVAAAAAYLYVTRWAPDKAAGIADDAGPIPWSVMLSLAVVAFIAAAAWRPRAGLVALAFCLGSLWLFMGWVVAPALNGVRSGGDFVAAALAKAPPDHELGMVAYKEQFLLYLDRPMVNFGHRRWREGPQESYDAARWLNDRAARAVLVNEKQRAQCFTGAASTVFAGFSAGVGWSWVTAPADAHCAALGKESALLYRPQP